ncbi:MAG: hypothetical protein LH630_05815 [Actinomycetia bacterium]|nr:hypothetical protein [Actinomycetes bacterium]
MTMGIRARARLSIVDDPDLAGAWAALASGSKSLLFQFPGDGVDQPNLISLGALVTTPGEVPLARGDVGREVLLNFWDDAARLHVHEAAQFGVWYSRTIGSGEITAVLDDLFDE